MAHVANTVSRITVTPTTSNGNASIDHLDGDGNALMDVDMVTAGHQVDLEVGENTIKVQVTAEDTTTTETYTVVVTRAGTFYCNYGSLDDDGLHPGRHGIHGREPEVELCARPPDDGQGLSGRPPGKTDAWARHAPL